MNRRSDLSSPSKRHKDNPTTYTEMSASSTTDSEIQSPTPTIDTEPQNIEKSEDIDLLENEGRGRSRVKTRIVSLGQPDNITLMGYNTSTSKPISRESK